MCFDPSTTLGAWSRTPCCSKLYDPGDGCVDTDEWLESWFICITTPRISDVSCSWRTSILWVSFVWVMIGGHDGTDLKPLAWVCTMV
jgi:hypothetical protein